MKSGKTHFTKEDPLATGETGRNMDINSSRLHDLLIQYKHNAAVRKIVRGSAHEYNNIFTGLSGQLSLLSKKDEIDHLQHNRQKEIDKLIERGRRQTELLSLFAQVGEKRSWNSLNLLVDHAIILLNMVSRIHHFIFMIEEQCSKFYCNPQELMSAIFYLGENAIEATEDGGLISIKLAEQREGEIKYFVVEVINQGEGFSESVTVSSLSPFDSKKTGQTNFGLGLFTANAIVSKYNGCLIIDHHTTDETRIAIRIPFEENHSEKKARSEETHECEVGCEENNQKHVFLIVDDEQSMRSILLHQLQRKNHIVFCASSCSEAVEVFENLAEIISAVIIDVGLDEEDGFTCAKQLKQISRDSLLVFMSGQDIDDYCNKHPDTLFLQKPFTSSQLEQLIHEATR